MNIREYNFSISGVIDRHIPGIPGTWPFGSRVQVDEDNHIISVWPEGAEPVVPVPPQEEPTVTEMNTVETPPALPEQPIDPTEQLSTFVSRMR